MYSQIGKVKNKTRHYIGLVQFLVENNKRMKLGRLAFELGVSYKHFRYYILPMVLDVADCLEYEKENDELVYTCSIEEAIREEARGELERLGVSG